MKTIFDVLDTFGLTAKTSLDGKVYRCKVFTRGGNLLCEGLGTTKESAEDTAFYGAKISLLE